MEVEQLERKHGGARKGSGPKIGSKLKKTIAKEAATLYLIRKVEESISELTTALLDKAKEGDISALKEAFERGLGKVKEIKEITVRKQLPLDEPKQNNSVSENKALIEED